MTDDDIEQEKALRAAMARGNEAWNQFHSLLLDELRKEPTAQTELAFMCAYMSELFLAMIFRYNMKLTREIVTGGVCRAEESAKEFFEHIEVDTHVNH